PVETCGSGLQASQGGRAEGKDPGEASRAAALPRLRQVIPSSRRGELIGRGGIARLFLLGGILLGTACAKDSPSPPPAAPTTPTSEKRQKSAALVQRGKQFLSDDLGEEAIRVLQEARRLDPASGEAALALASAYRQVYRVGGAKKIL